MRYIFLRFAIPTLLAVSLMAYLMVPYTERLLADWFRTDMTLRAQVLADSMSGSLARLGVKGSEKELRRYLSSFTRDERLLGLLLCLEDTTALYRADRTPESIRCDSLSGLEDQQSRQVKLPSGSVEVSSFYVTAEDGRQLRAYLLQDLSFIDRRQSKVRNYVVATAVIFAGILALLAGSTFWLLLRRWVSLLVGDIRSLRFLDDAHAEESQPILRQVRRALRELETSQRLEIDYRENWTPQALQQVVRDYLGSPEVFIVSNREPYIHNEDEHGITMQVPASGMVTALEPIVRATAGTWVAHGSGTADRKTVDRNDHVRVPPDDPAYTLRRVWLTPEEEQGYYYGFSNEGLWPLCHLAYVRPAFREQDWLQYQNVNRRFAKVLADEARSRDPVILVQDYHFALLPLLLRKHRPEATIALFWHIPWPNAETFGVCPWKNELLMHMLAADILGFHTRYHCQNFLASCDRFVECQIDHEHMTVTYGGHVCRVVPYPISIEWPPRWLAQVPDIRTSQHTIRSRYRIGEQVRLGLGVERWDFTKGILERFLAIETLLEKEPSFIGRLTFLQVAAPSRSQLPAYQALQEQTVREVKRVNEKFGNDQWQPIVLIDHYQDPRAVFELLRAVDFCIVNSLHDGMNLVAKEFVASRDDEGGVLILSTFTGASRELPEALLINPFDVGETAEAMKQAMQMSRDEIRERMKLMRRTVKQNNVYRWAGRMLMDAGRVRQQQALIRKRSPLERLMGN